MFEASDFELSLEKELRLRVIDKEIEECMDIKAIKDQLKICSHSLMKYQHLLEATLKRQITYELTNFMDKIDISQIESDA